MGAFRITKAAERDLIQIGRYTRQRWGDAQCRAYLLGLDARFQQLVSNPKSGRSCDDVRAGYWRYHEGKHVIFYRLGRRGVLEIIRILHERMLPELHL